MQAEKNVWERHKVPCLQNQCKNIKNAKEKKIKSKCEIVFITKTTILSVGECQIQKKTSK